MRNNRWSWRLVATATVVLSLGSSPSWVGAQEALIDGFPAELALWAPTGDGASLFEGAVEGAWDRKIRERGWILREGDRYRLWYTGYDERLSPTRFLGHATSEDGIHWRRDPAGPLAPESFVEDMCVLKVDGTYQMFAEGKGDIAHRLSSPDGLNWREHGPLDVRGTNGEPISPGPYGTPTVWVEDGKWYLFYERGDRGVWLAISDDLRVWRNVSDEPVLAMGPDAYDREAVAVNQVFKRGDTYFATYHANDRRPWGPWTTCLARSKDLVHWEKYPRNPMVVGNRSSGIYVPDDAGRLILYTMHPDVRRHEPAPASKAGGGDEP